ncbi:MAG TPA: UvrD-helicase domain-containing protein [Anaerolineae bacterium]
MSKVYLVGPAGGGKTSRLTSRLGELIGANTRPDRILVLVPQKAQAKRFRAELAQIKGAHKARGEPTLTTIYGLAQQHVSLFYPLIAERAGFVAPQREPVLLNVEAAQYFLNQIVEPRIADFDDLKLYRPRLLGQILDSMNKSAECSFPLDEIATRLNAAWSGETQRLVSYRRVQEVALDFRAFCLEHSLLDFSLLIDTFARHLLQAPSYRDYIIAHYRHILADNIEENPPVMHDFLAEVLKTCDSAMLAEDDPGGYRLFLGADVDSARTLRAHCDEVITLGHSYTASPEAITFGDALRRYFTPRETSATLAAPVDAVEATALQPRDALGDAPGSAKYWTGMVDWVVDHVVELVGQGTHPREIAVLAPYVEDVLRFELQERLRPAGVRVRTVRPSRPLNDHPIVRMLVVFTRLAHPEWDEPVAAPELARALSVGIGGLDVARAHLIADAALRASKERLAPLDDADMWQRVGMRFYEPYRTIVQWLAPGESLNVNAIPLDLYWQQLFTDVLSKQGFGLHGDLDGALVCDKLIQSARGYREVFERSGLQPGIDLAREYIETLGEDILAAQYAPEREPDIADDDAVLVMPAHTYLVSNFNSRYQFWLDINSQGWYERVYQPLTHPYVLSRRWVNGRVWTEEDEHRTGQLMLGKVLSGLTYHCSDRVYVATSQYSISGQEEDGPLARAIQRVIGAQGRSNRT